MGRPKGSKNKPKDPSKIAPVAGSAPKRGRPKGSKNKPKKSLRPYMNETVTKEARDKLVPWLEKKGHKVTVKLARGMRMGNEKLYYIWLDQ